MGELTVYTPIGDTIDATVIIGVYGDPEWDDRAHWLAQSLMRHLIVLPNQIIVSRATTLASARNDAAKEATTEWLIFLDADDDLDNEFLRRADRVMGFQCDIIKVAVRGFNADGFIDEFPIMGADFPLLQRNHFTIGCPVRQSMWYEVGGFDEDYPCLEDWAFWMKCDLAGAKVRKSIDTVYLIGDDHMRSQHPESNTVATKIRQKFRPLYKGQA